jgi:predicted enzyme related to lactoylglutathione lyase
MIMNRSVPVDTVLPHVVYQNVAEAVAWLSQTFGFREQYRYGEPVSGAQIRLGKAWIMIRTAEEGCASPAQLGYGTQSLTVFVEDIDAHFLRAKTAGAKIVEDLHETEYGELQYAAVDLDGHHWLFSRHARDLGPEEWGAKVTEFTNPIALRRHPSFCYLQIPAVDIAQSAAFYEKVFGWNIRRRDTAEPSFDDASGNISGAWVTGRKISREPGLLPYIWVDDIETTVVQAAAHGGEIVEIPHPDHPGGTSWIATFRDPAGNVMGLYQEDKK